MPALRVAAAVMTDIHRSRSGQSVGLATTSVVLMGSAAAVGWAATVPSSASQPRPAHRSDNEASLRAATQLDMARGRLAQVRRDIAQLLSAEDKLPRATSVDLARVTPQLPMVQVPQASVQQPVAPAPPPATHTTTGASGAPPP